MKKKFFSFLLLASGLMLGTSAWANVAKIGTTEYSTLQSAVNAAANSSAASGEAVTIDMIANTVENVTIGSTQAKIVLNMGTYTLTGNSYSTSAALIVKGTLTINATKNTDGTYTGGIASGKSNAPAITLGDISDYANITINGGTYTGSTESTGPSVIRANAEANCDITINGGKFVGSQSAQVMNYYGLIYIEHNDAKYEKNLTITGGEFVYTTTGTPSTTFLAADVIYYNEGAASSTAELSHINISGGKFTHRNTKATSSNGMDCANVLLRGNFENLYISGGTFDSDGANCYLFNVKSGDVNIRGGEYKGGKFAAFRFDYIGDAINMSNVDITSTGYGIYFLPNSNASASQTALNFKSGTMKGAYGIFNVGGVFNFMGGKIEGGIYNYSTGKINITGGTGIGIVSNPGTMTISGGNISSTGTNTVKNTGTLTISGDATITNTNASGYCLYNDKSGCVATVNGGKFSANASATSPVYNNAGTVTLNAGVYNITPDPTSTNNGCTLGDGLSVITNPDATTKAEGYLYALGAEDYRVTVYPGSSNSSLKSLTKDEWETYLGTQPNAVAFVAYDPTNDPTTAAKVLAFAKSTNNVVLDEVNALGVHTRYCPNFVLQDKDVDKDARDFYTPYSFIAVAGSYERSLGALYNTCSVPFALSTSMIDDANAKLLTFAEIKPEEDGTKKAYFNEFSSLTASTPCLIYCSQAATLHVDFSQTTVEKDPTNQNNLFGTFQRTSKWNGEEDVYSLLSDGSAFGKCAAPTVYSFRGVLSLKASTEIGTAPSRLAIGIVGPQGIVTNVEEAMSADKTEKVLLNGKLYIRMNGKLFDVAGQLVK